ncbi:MAG: succinate dehydrogenase assembly factor 2 [Pseudolabrys sp.]
MTTRSSEGLDERRRRLLFRSWHTGIREVDLIMGPFADARLASLNDADLGLFENLLSVPSPELMSWVMREAEPPAGFDISLLTRLRAFHLDKKHA